MRVEGGGVGSRGMGNPRRLRALSCLLMSRDMRPLSCVQGFGVDYRKKDLPDILFYASYDKSFSLANMGVCLCIRVCVC